MPPMTILVATDFSPPARLAVDRAAQLARDHGARLALLHAFDLARWRNLRALATPKRRLLADQPNARAGAALRALAERLQREHGIRVTARMAMGRAAQSIADAARAESAGLVVLGPHGRRAGDVLLLGSTALAVARGSDCAALVVRNPAPAPYTRALVGMDFSPASERGAVTAATLFPGARITLLHAVQSVEGPMLLTGALQEAIRSAKVELRKRAAARLEAAFPGAQPGRLGAARRRAVIGPAAPALLRLEKQGSFELIVVGRDARAALAERVLGSVPANLLMHARADLLIVP